MNERLGFHIMFCSRIPAADHPALPAWINLFRSPLAVATLSLIWAFLLLTTGTAAMAQAPGYEVVATGSLKPGAPIPPPKNEVILTIRGATSKSAEAGLLRFDRATFETVGMIRYTSKNRWHDKPLTYEGVLGSQLLQIIGVPKNSKFLLLRALNDYAVRIPVSDFSRWPLMFALKLDGKYMTVREKGPIWVVYPNHMYPELGRVPHVAKWIWQLKSIEFE